MRYICTIIDGKLNLNTSKQKIQELEDRLTQMDSNYTKLENKYTQQNNHFEEVKQTLKDRIDEIVTKDSKIMSLMEQLDALNLNANSSSATLQQMIMDKEKQIEELRSKNYKLKSEVNFSLAIYINRLRN